MSHSGCRKRKARETGFVFRTFIGRHRLINLVAFGALMAVLLCVSCAENELSEGNAGRRQDADLSQNNRADASDIGNDDMPRVGQDDGFVVDMGRPDMNCTAVSPVCVDAQTVRRCQADGSALEEVACAQDERCDQGVCVGAVCQPGDKRCSTATTLLVCRTDGSGFLTEACAQGESCALGRCISGNPNGVACSDSTECASGQCLCSSLDSDALSCDPTITSSLCTQVCSGPEECAEDEVCADITLGLLGIENASTGVCLPSCSGACSREDLRCRSIPTFGSDDMEWSQSCLPSNVANAGDWCASDAQCSTGNCLMDYFADGFCTSRCENSSCPDDQICAELRPNELWCTLPCQAQLPDEQRLCPLEAVEARVDVQCRLVRTKSDGFQEVCASTR